MLETEFANSDRENASWKKLLAFILVLGLCMLIGNVILIALAIAGGMSFENGLDIFSAISEPSMRPYIKAGIGFNHLVMFTGTAILFAIWLRRKKWKSYFHFAEIDFSLLIRFMLLLICAYPLIGISATLFEGVEWVSQIDESSMDALMKMLQMDSFPDLLVNLVIVAMLPAIGEELLFRGVIQKELLAKISNHHVAIIVTSIIFSAVHLQIQGFLPKFIIGMILGYAYYWTKSIWYPMVLHFINNAIPTIALFFVGEDIESMQEEAIQPEKLILIMSVVFSCFLCYLIIRNIQDQLKKKKSLMSSSSSYGE